MSPRIGFPSPWSSRRRGALLSLAAVLWVTLAASGAFAADLEPSVTPVPSIDPADFNNPVPDNAPVGPIADREGPLPAPPPISGAPSLLTSFDGNTIDTSIPLTGGYLFIPPDPIGAAGIDHVVSVTNVVMEFRTKTGVLTSQQLLRTFFAPLAPINFLFDPKVIYDQHADRFVIVALEVNDALYNGGANISRILVAVSDDSDPNGTWYFRAINSAVNFVNPSLGVNATHWADYPGLAVDDEAVYITANMFNFGNQDPGGLGRRYFGDTRLWIVHKDLGGGFYAGGPATVTVHDPSLISGEFTQQPAHVFGANPPGNGTFLVSAGWSQDFGLGSGAGQEAISVTRVDNPLTAPTFSQQFVLVGNIEDARAGIPDAQQMGCALVHPKELPPDMDVDAGDRRAYHAVWRSNRLYVTSVVLPAAGVDANQVTAHWWDVNTTNVNTLAIQDQGNIGGEDIAPGMATFYPSVAVDDCGNVAFGFAASNQTIHPGAYYTGRRAGDPAGTVQPTGLLAAGQDCYRRAFCGSRNRWGDYSGISLDPANGNTFWVFNEYALTRGTPTACISTSPPDTLREYGRWGTRWGAFNINQPPVAQCKNITVMGDSTVVCVARYVSPADVDDGSYDPEGDPITMVLDPAGPYTLGDTSVLLIVTDSCGLSDTCQARITVECPVPVKLASFRVQRDGGAAVLTWDVSEAENHAGFEVYRQERGAERVKLSQELLSGWTHYEFVDQEAPSGRVDYWLGERSRTGLLTWHGPVTLEPASAVPTALTLAPGRPNPFTASTRIAYGIPEARQVRVSVYDAQGRVVKTLLDAFQAPGEHSVTWDGRVDGGTRAASGFYLIRLDAGSESRIQKVVLTR